MKQEVTTPHFNNHNEVITFILSQIYQDVNDKMRKYSNDGKVLIAHNLYEYLQIELTTLYSRICSIRILRSF